MGRGQISDTEAYKDAEQSQDGQQNVSEVDLLFIYQKERKLSEIKYI